MINPEIEALHRIWLEHELAGRIDELVNLCTHDVTFRPPGEAPVAGRDAVRRYLAASQAQIVSIEISGLETTVNGGTATKTARFATRVAGHDDVFRGQHKWLLRQTPQGWCIHELSWTMD